jgi:hypothetical protein
MLKTDSTVTTEAGVHAVGAGATSACCGGPAPDGREGCCAQDAALKASGGRGCGCNSARQTPAEPETSLDVEHFRQYSCC